LITFDDLKENYLFAGVDLDFAEGRRQILRYAFENAYAYCTPLCLKGPGPFEYLDYAKRDVAKGDTQGAINGISNAKRAIHLTIDIFFKLLGLENAYYRARFPAKLELMELLNAFPTQLINNLNQKRNLVEHKYLAVAPEEAKEFVHIAEMFLLLVHPYLKHVTIGAIVGLQGNECCFEWRLEPLENKIRLYEVADQSHIDTPVGRVYINYQPAVSLAKKLIGEVKITKANCQEWLPYLDLFVYMTRKNATQMPRADSRGSSMYFVEHGSVYIGSPTTG
jgi:hypothetical protein